MCRSFLKSTLRWLSIIILKRYKPDIIAITGSIGKTSAKEACFYALSQKFSARRTEKNYGTEFGVPAAIIGVEVPSRQLLIKWLIIFIKAIGLIIIKSKKYPQILVLEMAADKPGDIKYFMSFIKPKISIITSISQVHLEKFAKFSQIIAEKRQIIECLPPEGYAVLNFDDEHLKKTACKTKARILAYGLNSQEAILKAQDVKVILKDNQIGLYFKLLYKGTATPVFAPGTAAVHQIYSLLAAATCGSIYKLTALEIAQGLEKFQSLPGRFTVKKGQNNTWLIDDAYNAAPVSVCAALQSLSDFPTGKRKIAVLGDMLELGSFENKGHKQVGECAASQKIDLLLTYGERAKMIGKSAEGAGMAKSRIQHFDNQDKLIDYLRENMQPDDVILIKGSHGMKMGEVAEKLKT
ncbi:MAG: UDP-N-acetylmuramoyl-tripeptide--D-alanyl-D-alanine ligase [Candidatus Jacksonbacteria bacterium]